MSSRQIIQEDVRGHGMKKEAWQTKEGVVGGVLKVTLKGIEKGSWRQERMWQMSMAW